MNKTKIEWCDYTWNPIIGCKNNCYYCYARKMNDRFHLVKNWNKPEYFEERLNEPYNLKKPSVIFVGSMSDVSFWEGWQKHIIANVCRENPRHTFLFLTKNPAGDTYFKLFDNIENVYLGVTITGKEDDYKAYDLRHQLGELTRTRQRRFISIEPLLGEVDISIYDSNIQIIVGAMTGINPVIPKVGWIEKISKQAKNIFWKNNIRKYLPKDIKIKENLKWSKEIENGKDLI